MKKLNAQIKALNEKLNVISNERSALLDRLWLLEQEGMRLRIDIEQLINTLMNGDKNHE